MVDDKEDHYEGEEGEYHFSDDQVNYDEVPKASTATGPLKKSIFEKFSGLSGSRRMLLAGVVFLSLIGIVYKMLLPSSSPLPTEISQAPVKPLQPQVATTKPALPTAPAAQPVAPPPQVAAPLAPPETPVNAQAAMPPMTSAPNNPPALAGPTQPSTAPAQQPPLGPDVSHGNVVDRVKAVEDHNAAMMNLLQTEYAQKMSEFEMQSNLVRGKMDEMAKRINRIESSLNQITQMLQQAAPPSKSQATSMEHVALAASKPFVPKIVYNVQAIIPGRAWLKADSGDTVTVAEGDILKDYGRITKIDPYDGVVEIDTGNKIIALSYGMSGE